MNQKPTSMRFFVHWFSSIRYKNNTDHHPVVRWEKCTAPQSKNHTREIGAALPQASCVWNSEAEKLCSDSHGSPRCYDKVMLFLGNHIPDFYLALTLGRIYSSLFLAVFLARCAKGLWMSIYGFLIWTSAPRCFILLLQDS